MQPMKILAKFIQENANNQHYLFSMQDLRALLPSLSNGAFKTLLTRSVKSGFLERICRNLYGYKINNNSNGLLLFHAASYLRSNEFNYISLETALSETGVISQIPINVITIMSSGRSNKIYCGKFGVIEFIHTNQRPEKIIGKLFYDKNCRMWRAKVDLAINDMRKTHRNLDLIDWDIANEFI